jgi:hypothetical protein
MPEQTPKITYPELIEQIDHAANAAEANHSYKRKDYSTGFKEWIRGENEFLAVDIARDCIEGYGEGLNVDIHAKMPSELVATADYAVVIERNRPHTQIIRRNEAGEIIYWHRTKNPQLAMRLGSLGARLITHQPTQAIKPIRQAA